MRTTIQVSEELRKRLRVFASNRGVSYEESLNDFMDMFQSLVPFKNEWEFAEWFEKNLDQFGFKRIVEKKKGFPDYKLEDANGKLKRVELELMGIDFIRHKHDPKKVDMIVCVYSDRNDISGVPVLSVVESPKDLDGLTSRKRRCSISLDRELVEMIKRVAMDEGVSVSNYVESFLKEYFESSTTCVILAGGRPERLFIKELNTYRPLVDIGGRTLIEDIVSKCSNSGFRNIIIIGFRRVLSMLRKILLNGEKYNAKITYIEEAKELGSGKTLKLARGYLKTDFLFLPCDHYFDFDLKKLREFHAANNGLVTLGIHTRTNFDWRGGIVELEGDKIIDFEERPKKPRTFLSSVFIGFMKKDIFYLIPPNNEYCSLQENIFPVLAKKGELFGYPVAGNWVNIHTKADVEKAKSMNKNSSAVK